MSVPQSLSIRRAKSIYLTPVAVRKRLPQRAEILETKVEKENSFFFVKSVSDELAEAHKPMTRRRSSFGLVSQEVLSKRVLEDEIYLAKKKLSKFSSVEFCPDILSHRGQRGVEDACRALLAVEDLYKKQNTLDLLNK